MEQVTLRFPDGSLEVRYLREPPQVGSIVQAGLRRWTVVRVSDGDVYVRPAVRS